jgi:hypothetical protein
MMVGGIDHEGELAVARIRMKLEQDAAMTSLAESERLRREEGEEQFRGRLWALTVMGVIYVLYLLFG